MTVTGEGGRQAGCWQLGCRSTLETWAPGAERRKLAIEAGIRSQDEGPRDSKDFFLDDRAIPKEASSWDADSLNH